MKKILLFTILALPLTVLAQNSCSEALTIQLGITTVDSVSGQIYEEACYGNPSAQNPEYAEWYAYTPEENEYLKISSNLSQNAGGDTRLQIYTGSCYDLVCFGGADDLQGGNYLTMWEGAVEAGVQYYIVWDDRWSENGFDFELSSMEPPILEFLPQNLQGNGNKLGFVDMNGDNLDDVVGISFVDDVNVIQITYQQPNTSLIYSMLPTESPWYLPIWSMAAGDLDANGYNDLVFGGGGGVSFMFANENGTAYTHKADSNYVFSQRSNCVDINNDGFLDAFVCHDVQPNVYYMNVNNDTLIYNQGGIGDVPNGGNYGSLWVDYDLDGDTDLFISKCRGGQSPARINELHQNNGDGTYTEIAASLGLNDSIQTWSSAFGDYDNDGDFDIFIGAYSLADGPQKLLRNDNGVFVDITASSGLVGTFGTGTENVTHDFDNDGYLDILGMGGTFMHNNGDMTFTEIPIGPGNGPIGDINNDGFLDIVQGNTLYINQGNDNNYIKVVPKGVESNLNGIGSLITVYTPSGTYMRQIFSGDGFKFMSSLTAHFGLGQETVIDSIKVIWPSGNVDVQVEPVINQMLVITESGSITPVGINNTKDVDLRVYPNPAKDYLLIDFPNRYQSLTYSIFDLNGKLMQQGIVKGKSIQVSKLASGAYLLQLNADGRKVGQKIIKE